MAIPRVLLADDHRDTRALLRSLLESEFEVVADVENGQALISAASELMPDIIVTDISMPCVDGIAAATVILRANPLARIVFITVHGDISLVERGLSTGALGYVLKLAAGDELMLAVRAALGGERYISRTLRRPARPQVPDTGNTIVTLVH